jgi:hypothetical protein
MVVRCPRVPPRNPGSRCALYREGMEHRAEVERVIAVAAQERDALLAQLPAELRASLPVDATGVTQAIEHLAGAVGLADAVRAEQARLHRANPAVLHGRVFGREPLAPATVMAAFVDGARVRAAILLRLAEAIDGLAFRREVEALLAGDPPPEDADTAALRAHYAAQERAATLCAARLDAIGRPR